MKIYCDGSLKEYCFVTVNIDGNEVVHRGSYAPTDKQTNNSSEYHAVINAMLWAKSKWLKDVTFYTDSKLVVEQVLSGTKPQYVWKCKNDRLRKLRNEVRFYLGEIAKITNRDWDEVLKWISREYNKAGIILG